ncbi:MAG TPA: hypothetical protein VGL05_19305 [Kribbella sp.]
MTPDDPRHGRRSGYLAGCRNTCCSEPNRRWTKQWRLQAARNGGRTTVPTEPIRQHVLQLQSSMSLSAIGKACGMNSSQMVRLVRGDHPRMWADTARRLLAVRPDMQVGGAYVSAVGSRRRVQALVAVGYGLERIEPYLSGYGRTNLRMLANGDRGWITSDVAQRIKAAYEELSMRQPAAPTRQHQAGITKSRNRARALGWVSPLAWDDDTIDDPNARPVGVITAAWDPAGCDDARIERRINGDRTIRLHRGESVEVVRRMLADGHTQNEIRRLTGLKPERYMAEIRAARQTEEAAA